MSETASLLGSPQLDLGPANIYLKQRFINSVETDWDSDSDYLSAGKTESTTLRLITGKTELKSSQGGERPDDKVVTSQQCQVEAALGQATLERLALFQQGIELIKNSAGDIVRWMFTKKLGQRDSDNQFWVKVIKINAGVESTDPLEISYMRASPSTDSVDIVFDSATQRFFGTIMEAYENVDGDYPVISPDTGAAAYIWSKEDV